MARRSRKSRSDAAGQTTAPASPFIKRSASLFRHSGRGKDRGAGASGRLADRGCRDAFRTTLSRWISGAPKGRDLDGDIIRAPADWIRSLCAKAPSKFTQIARNPERSVEIGGDNQVFAPIYGAPFVRDLEGGRRYGDIASFNDLVRLTYMLPSLHHGGFVTCEPCDVPVNKRHLDMLLAQ
ncbi:MAG: hypothetical protein CM15mP115_23910 [Alphaproteobacteria bacterium]|nr:MAG: hypothetical protein CM15mP115_23910 [Alphaproteobacteria bacterium]